MRESVEINGLQVRLSASLDWLFVYRRAFREDALPLLFRQLPGLIPALTGEDIQHDSIDVTFLLRVLWSMAKSADRYLESPEEWAAQWDEFPLGDILPDLADILYCSSVALTHRETQGESKADERPVTIDMILAGGLKRGLLRSDCYDMTLSEWTDYINGYDELFGDTGSDNEPEATKATQSDFDRFKRS